MDAESRLREYIIKKHGEIEPKMGTPIIQYREKELNTNKCEMCSANIHMKKSFVYEPMMKNLTHANMTICESCAKREHGSKNRYKWKQLMEDLNG